MKRLAITLLLLFGLVGTAGATEFRPLRALRSRALRLRAQDARLCTQRLQIHDRRQQFQIEVRRENIRPHANLNVLRVQQHRCADFFR